MSFHSVSKMSRKGAPLADVLEAASSAGAAAPATADAATPSVLSDEPINRRRLFVIKVSFRRRRERTLHDSAGSCWFLPAATIYQGPKLCQYEVGWRVY